MAQPGASRVDPPERNCYDQRTQKCHRKQFAPVAGSGIVKPSAPCRCIHPLGQARAEALATGKPVPIDGRKCALMPAWSDQNIFITIHFDPGSGITFAIGAARVYFQPGRTQGDPPQTEEHVFVVDRVDSMNPETERARLVEFITLVSGWLEDVSTANDGLPADQRVSSHIFFWDLLEVRQLRRVFERHMNHPDVVDLIELLIRLFPLTKCFLTLTSSSLSRGRSSRLSCACYLDFRSHTTTPSSKLQIHFSRSGMKTVIHMSSDCRSDSQHP